MWLIEVVYKIYLSSELTVWILSPLERHINSDSFSVSVRNLSNQLIWLDLKKLSFTDPSSSIQSL